MREILNDRFVEGFLNMADNASFEKLKKQVSYRLSSHKKFSTLQI